ncbi:alpha/beta hydrolase [Pelagibius litoralis]|uniref:Palmitoyl-protein thioesterase ABHD10, mitochondrial n=1 Tax=Pelagibius litoralis TaxID=374515 RepID=A0A967EUZ3_9PROT|nr:alpha/beta hydrolase [Pelagibius litoralis]NIA67941.1 alpha/beta hydrolase [Pelagibius litoralis]
MSNPDSPTDQPPQTLACEDGTILAYYKTATGKASAEGHPDAPGLLFLGGFMSDMTGSKALALEDFAGKRGQAFVRFDYRGHGASEGRFTDGTIGTWLADALAVLDRLTEGPQIVVGSSMGGWIMLLLALARPERIAGLVGIAAAPDFTEEIIGPRTTDAFREKMAQDGYILYPSAYSEEPYTITNDLIEEGRNHLLLKGPIPITAPVRLLYGMQDSDVPWQMAVRLCELLESRDVELSIVKNAGHRFSEPAEIDLLLRTVAALSDPQGLPES